MPGLKPNHIQGPFSPMAARRQVRTRASSSHRLVSLEPPARLDENVVTPPGGDFDFMEVLRVCGSVGLERGCSVGLLKVSHRRHLSHLRMGFGLMQPASGTRAEFIRFPGEVDAASADKMDGCSPLTCPAKGAPKVWSSKRYNLSLVCGGKFWEERGFAKPSWV